MHDAPLRRCHTLRRRHRLHSCCDCPRRPVCSHHLSVCASLPPAHATSPYMGVPARVQSDAPAAFARAPPSVDELIFMNHEAVPRLHSSGSWFENQTLFKVRRPLPVASPSSLIPHPSAFAPHLSPLAPHRSFSTPAPSPRCMPPSRAPTQPMPNSSAASSNGAPHTTTASLLTRLGCSVWATCTCTCIGRLAMLDHPHWTTRHLPIIPPPHPPHGSVSPCRLRREDVKEAARAARGVEVDDEDEDDAEFVVQVT
jgi:hypothetical protein